MVKPTASKSVTESSSLSMPAKGNRPILIDGFYFSHSIKESVSCYSRVQRLPLKCMKRLKLIHILHVFKVLIDKRIHKKDVAQMCFYKIKFFASEMMKYFSPCCMKISRVS